jgi:hypothetical protein
MEGRPKAAVRLPIFTWSTYRAQLHLPPCREASFIAIPYIISLYTNPRRRTEMAFPSVSPAPPAGNPSLPKPDIKTTIHSSDPISKVVVDTGRKHTFYANERGVRFNLVALHRMNMHYLRKRLIDQAATIFKNGVMDDEDSKTLTSLMRDYCALVTRPFLLC